MPETLKLELPLGDAIGEGAPNRVIGESNMRGADVKCWLQAWSGFGLIGIVRNQHYGLMPLWVLTVI